jgi:hypothetical protein
MATTVDAAFDQLLAWISTMPAETAAAKSHRANIEKKLREEFGLNGFFRTGSFGNGTNVSNLSDVDYFAVIPPITPRPSSTHQRSRGAVTEYPVIRPEGLFSRSEQTFSGCA